jgi:hypothetical protein
VVVVEQSIRLAAPPPRIERQTNLKDGGDRPQFLKGEPLKKPGFDESDQLLANASSLGNVSLAPAQPQADKAEKCANMRVVHAAILMFGGLPPAYWPVAASCRFPALLIADTNAGGARSPESRFALRPMLSYARVSAAHRKTGQGCDVSPPPLVKGRNPQCAVFMTY